MANPLLPTDLDATYADDATDASVKAHQQQHDAVHARTDYYPEDYGYSAGGTAAAKTTALQAFLNDLTAGKTGVLRHGLLYEHDAVLTVPSSCAGGRLVVEGELRATVETASALKIHAPGFHVEGGGSLTTPTVTARGSSTDHHKIYVGWNSTRYDVGGVRLEGFTVDGSHAAGVFLYGVEDYLVRDVLVKNTRADAFHNTDGSRRGRFRSCTAQEVGDDGMAVVSYAGGPAPVCEDIDVQGHRVRNSYARGLSVVGGRNIHYTDCHVDGSFAAGAYIASETSYNSYGCEWVRFRGLWLRKSGDIVNPYGGTSPDHGACMFYASNTEGLTDVSMTDVEVDDTRSTVSSNIRFITSNASPSARVTVANVLLRGTGPASDVGGNMPTSERESINITRLSSWGT